jgi:hypothetical protein
MAKPRELFNTPAPQAMSLMGQGIADAYANVGRIEGQGMQALGQGIAQGIGAVANAVADYKKMSSQVKSSENFYKTMRDYLPPEMTKGIDTVVGGEVYKNMSTAEKAQLWGDVRAYNVAALGQYHKMQQIEAEQKGLFDRAKASAKPPVDTSAIAGLKQVTATPSQPESGAPTQSPAPSAMPGADFDLNSAVDKLEVYMINQYGPDYKARKIQPSYEDTIRAGIRTK